MTQKDGGCAEFIRENSERILDEVPDLDATISLENSVDTGLPNKSVELVVTSPPYPMIEMWEEKFGGYDEIHDMIEEVLEECYRVLVKGGIVCVNIGDATRSYGNFQCFPNHAEVLIRARGIGLDTLVPIHWMKPTNRPNSFLGSGFLPPNAYVTLDTEYILILRKGGPREVDSDVLRKASQYTKEERDIWFSQQWKVKGETQDGMAVFPREIPYRLIRMFSVLGDTVMDPFCGTGTTIEVARALGRSADGYEVNEDLRQHFTEKVDRVSDITWEDILENFIRNEERDIGVDGFVSNNSSLIDFL